MIVDPDKQFVDEDTEVIVDKPVSKDDVVVKNPVDITKYGLVAKVAHNGIILLYEWMPLEEARKYAQKVFEDM